jgi:hypothetical protein
MGALVLTKGTRLLIKQLNQEFGKHLHHYRNDNNDGTATPIRQLFAGRNENLGTLTDKIKQPHSPRGDRRSLLPDDPSGHTHIEARWKYFLAVDPKDPNNPNRLTQPNHDLIRTEISKVLGDPSYDHIEFDSIEFTPQTVFVEDGWDDKGTTKCRRIILGTPPMANRIANDPNLSLDP